MSVRVDMNAVTTQSLNFGERRRVIAISYADINRKFEETFVLPFDCVGNMGWGFYEHLLVTFKMNTPIPAWTMPTIVRARSGLGYDPACVLHLLQDMVNRGEVAEGHYVINAKWD